MLWPLNWIYSPDDYNKKIKEEADRIRREEASSSSVTKETPRQLMENMRRHECMLQRQSICQHEFTYSQDNDTGKAHYYCRHCKLSFVLDTPDPLLVDKCSHTFKVIARSDDIRVMEDGGKRSYTYGSPEIGWDNTRRAVQKVCMECGEVVDEINWGYAYIQERWDAENAEEDLAVQLFKDGSCNNPPVR